MEISIGVLASVVLPGVNGVYILIALSQPTQASLGAKRQSRNWVGSVHLIEILCLLINCTLNVNIFCVGAYHGRTTVEHVDAL